MDKAVAGINGAGLGVLGGGSIQDYINKPKAPEQANNRDAMELKMHSSVKKVAEFIQKELPANEWRGVTEALAVAAPAIWSEFPEEKIHPIRLQYCSVT